MMDHYRDLTVYTTQAAQQVQTKAIADAGRLITDHAIAVTVNTLDADTKERLYGLLEQD